MWLLSENANFRQLDYCTSPKKATKGILCRIKEVCEGQKQIPFGTELDSGKWMYDSDKYAVSSGVFYMTCVTNTDSYVCMSIHVDVSVMDSSTTCA